MGNRLGVWSIKSELEDLCFKVSATQVACVLSPCCLRYQDSQWLTFPLSELLFHSFCRTVQAMRPQAHKDLSQQVERILSGSNVKISQFMGGVNAILKEQGIEVEDIEGRPKSIGSIREKQTPCRAGCPSKVCMLLPCTSFPQSVFVFCVHCCREIVLCNSISGALYTRHGPLAMLSIVIMSILQRSNDGPSCSLWRAYMTCWRCESSFRQKQTATLQCAASANSGHQ